MWKRRSRKGATNTIELPIALFIIFIMVLFPMIDLIYLALAYGCGYYGCHLATREAACRDPNITPKIQAANTALQAWKSSGLGAFIGVFGEGNVLNFVGPDNNGDGQGDLVQVITTMRVRPFLTIPFLCSVPGINAPITFTFSCERPNEETGIQ